MAWTGGTSCWGAYLPFCDVIAGLRQGWGVTRLVVVGEGVEVRPVCEMMCQTSSLSRGPVQTENGVPSFA